MMIELGLSQAGGDVGPFALPEASRFSEAQGHAIEARASSFLNLRWFKLNPQAAGIYAEIPHLAFKPAPGLLQEDRKSVV